MTLLYRVINCKIIRYVLSVKEIQLSRCYLRYIYVLCNVKCMLYSDLYNYIIYFELITGRNIMNIQPKKSIFSILFQLIYFSNIFLGVVTRNQFDILKNFVKKIPISIFLSVYQWVNYLVPIFESSFYGCNKISKRSEIDSYLKAYYI